MESIKGIIVSCNKYKDNDLILEILTEKGEIFSVTNRGGEKLKSMTHEFNMPFIKGEFEIYKANTKYYKLKAGKIETSLYQEFSSNFEYLNIYSLLKELSSKYPLVEDSQLSQYYKLYDFTIKNLIKSDRKYFYALLFVIVEIWLTGYRPDFTNLNYDDNYKVGLDLKTGEFINFDYEVEEIQPLDNSKVLLLSKMFKSKYDVNEQVQLSEEESIKLIKVLILYLGVVSETKLFGLI